VLDAVVMVVATSTVLVVPSDGGDWYADREGSSRYRGERALPETSAHVMQLPE
jgi:hypothetical protein